MPHLTTMPSISLTDSRQTKRSRWLITYTAPLPKLQRSAVQGAYIEIAITQGASGGANRARERSNSCLLRKNSLITFMKVALIDCTLLSTERDVRHR